MIYRVLLLLKYIVTCLQKACVNNLLVTLIASATDDRREFNGRNSIYAVPATM
jgi:hypothetical protein